MWRVVGEETRLGAADCLPCRGGERERRCNLGWLAGRSEHNVLPCRSVENRGRNTQTGPLPCRRVAARRWPGVLQAHTHTHAVKKMTSRQSVPACNCILIGFLWIVNPSHMQTEREGRGVSFNRLLLDCAFCPRHVVNYISLCACWMILVKEEEVRPFTKIKAAVWHHEDTQLQVKKKKKVLPPVKVAICNIK